MVWPCGCVLCPYFACFGCLVVLTIVLLVLECRNGLGMHLVWFWNGKKMFVSSGCSVLLVLDSVSDSNSLSHVVSGSSVSLNVGKVMSVPGRGVGHLFLHLLTLTGLSSVSLLDAMWGSAVVMESIWCGVGLCLYLCWLCMCLVGLSASSRWCPAISAGWSASVSSIAGPFLVVSALSLSVCMCSCST